MAIFQWGQLIVQSYFDDYKIGNRECAVVYYYGVRVVEGSEELSDIPNDWLPKLDITAPEGTRITAIDIIVRIVMLRTA
jgi:hypothetical protein